MEKKAFKAESQRLLDLMIHSIYTHKEIFLREIISNASDAIDKLCYLSLTDENVGLKREDFAITLSIDKENRTLTVSDNGIGMDADELENNLGVIASSGTFQFRQELDKEAEADVIGQFGVGFYSAFMVADHITGMMAAIESANGVLHAAEIAHASDRLIGIALGAEDYVTDLKTTRSDGIELLFARCMILNAARSAGIAALDTVYSDVNNEEGFIAEATLIKKLGFDGKSVINPRQIEPLHHVFMPSEKDLNKARAIMDAIAEANARGSGVASLKGKMIDKPVVTRAKRLLDLYEAGSKIDEVEEI